MIVEFGTFSYILSWSFQVNGQTGKDWVGPLHIARRKGRNMGGNDFRNAGFHFLWKVELESNL